VAGAVSPLITLGIDLGEALIPEAVQLYKAIAALHVKYPNLTAAQLQSLVATFQTNIGALDKDTLATTAQIPGGS
jgi:hypothetical protein